MKNLFVLTLCFTGCIISLNSCQKNASANDVKGTQPAGMVESPYAASPEWNSYWHQGKAELTSYDLRQSRYGEIHEGTVVNIFVTEDFSRSKQVKLDDGASAGADKLPILKLNQSYKFITGIYPYSMMMSAFQPIDIVNYPHAVKITSSVQEWCGMAFYQMNYRNNEHLIEQRSYFESEGDRDLKIKEVIQEDELWSLIRIDPSKLPTGSVDILPSSLYLRLSHQRLEPVKANLALETVNGMTNYTIDMPSLKRRVVISFEEKFPYKITGWEDSYPGLDGNVLTTSAVRKSELMLDYWRTHNNGDRKLREQLGISKDTQ